MPVTALDLLVPDEITARRLFVDLLGGHPVPPLGNPAAGASHHRDGATIRWRRGEGAGTRLTFLELGVTAAEDAVTALHPNQEVRSLGDGWKLPAHALGVDVVVREARTPRRPVAGCSTMSASRSSHSPTPWT